MIGCSYAEAAVICDCPVGTIRSRVARAREDLDALTARATVGPRPATEPAAADALEIIRPPGRLPPQ
jgi:RNA polymerase sigma-70 factor (ECF subfamily)